MRTLVLVLAVSAGIAGAGIHVRSDDGALVDARDVPLPQRHVRLDDPSGLFGDGVCATNGAAIVATLNPPETVVAVAASLQYEEGPKRLHLDLEGSNGSSATLVFTSAGGDVQSVPGLSVSRMTASIECAAEHGCCMDARLIGAGPTELLHPKTVARFRPDQEKAARAAAAAFAGSVERRDLAAMRERAEFPLGWKDDCVRAPDDPPVTLGAAETAMRRLAAVKRPSTRAKDTERYDYMCPSTEFPSPGKTAGVAVDTESDRAWCSTWEAAEGSCTRWLILVTVPKKQAWKVSRVVTACGCDE